MEIVSYDNGLVKWGMAKTPRLAPRTLYLGDWLEATNHTVGEAAKAGGVDQSYISNLIAGRKWNPGTAVLLGISELMGITINDLYRPVPPAGTLTVIRGLSTGARDALLHPRKRKA